MNKENKKWENIGNKLKVILIGALATAGIGVIAHISKKNPERLTREWMEKLSAEELDIEREKYRIEEYLKTGNRIILNLFDEVIRKKRYGDGPVGFPVHREHGWYLSNDD